MHRCSAITRDFAQPAATITLDEAARHRRRMMMTSDRMANGSTLSFLLDLPQARLLRHGDGLVLDDGRIVAVRALPEELYAVRGRDRRHLLSLTWQIGNRHLAAQIEEDHLLLRRDPVIRAMLEGLGASVSEIEAPFDPEGGAYGGVHPPHDHGHAHHGHGHHHD
ncbi:MAG: urease accessory protein UreE [Nitratireductor sp.]|nr:urease accessory protein UreE [Nitratireductor sp.]